MALKKPIVQYSGQYAQIQAGDTLDIAIVGGGNAVSQTNGEASPIVIGTPVYNDGNDSVKKAKADAAGTKDVIGIILDASIASGIAGYVQLDGILSATTGQWDAVAGTTGGLTKGTRYYLSAATAGLLTATAPSAVGQYVVEVGIAISTTELVLNVKSPLLL